jgi:uncharacterized protein (TIGR00255 family)
MIKSMTGFGIANLENEEYSISVEVKSLNSKFLDLNIKLPKIFSDKELEIRNLVNDTLERGKVSLSIDYSKKDQISSKVNFNKELFKKYYKELEEIAIELNASPSDLFKIVIQLPEVQNIAKENDDVEKDWSIVKRIMEEAIGKCNDFRMTEGNTLKGKLIEDVDNIQTSLDEVKKHAPGRLSSIRERIKNSIEEVVNPDAMDKNRFEQELIYYIEKLDINEETVRLKLHLDYFKEVITKESSPGKKLNFIGQEMGREINTIGSKANDSLIQKHVVNMKEELEKIKEQLLNII